MNEKIKETVLKTGERMEIVAVTTPDSEYAGKILSFLWHKGDIWKWHLEKCFRGETGDIESRFYAGVIGGEIAGNISTWEYRGTGILSHVFTPEKHRRKGICNLLMSAVMEDFRKRGKEFMTLGTGYDTPPYYIYKSFGFESMSPGSGSMLYCPDKDFTSRFFAPCEAGCRDLAWNDWPLVCALFASQAGAYLRNLNRRIFGPACFEESFLLDIKNLLEGRGQAKVLETVAGSVAGYASLFPHDLWINQVYILDVFVHPQFSSCENKLLESIIWPEAKVQCYVDNISSERINLLLKAGFRKEGTFLKQLKETDVIVMGRPVR